MCGRYALHTALARVAEELGAVEAPELAGRSGPGFNLAPGRPLPVCLADPRGRRTLVEMRWGLVPAWARDESIGARLINARAETVAVKPAFRSAFRRRRCLVPANGFFEWQKTASGKQPWFIQRADRRPMAMAGLWETREREGEPALCTFTILTTEANEAVAHCHHRMPVLVAAEDMDSWLTAGGDSARLLRPWPSEQTLCWPVSRRVNNAGNDDPGLLEAVPELPRA